MPKNEDLVVKEQDKICTLIINNPEKRNVLTPSILNSITETLQNIEKENLTRCVVIKGAGEKAFSSGYDISAIKDDDMTREFRNDHPLENCLKAIEEFPYPVIAMMNGHTFGAGLELAVTCDLRICVNDAKIALPPAKLGVVYSYSGTKKFLNLIGTASTKELLLVGNSIDAVRAYEIGLVNYVVERNEIENFTNRIAQDISQNAPLSLLTMKKLINIWQNGFQIKPFPTMTKK